VVFLARIQQEDHEPLFHGFRSLIDYICSSQSYIKNRVNSRFTLLEVIFSICLLLD
jgi:hypothetical protein